MGGQRTSFGKLQRDRAKKEKAAAKRERRLERGAGSEADADGGPPAAADGQHSAADLLERIQAVHQRYESGTISYEQFEEQKAELLSRLPLD